MTRLRKKLNSERGASILLAMLMLLVCCMVAASVMAAAVSNAGKARSVEVEQQKYLTLSSAIQLIADEIEQAKYTGKYTLYEWEYEDPDEEDPITYYYFYCKQETGDYSCGDLTDQLPLGKELDKIFSRQFTGGGYGPLTGLNVEDQTKRLLTVTLPTPLPGYTDSDLDVYQAEDVVTVQVELNHDTGHITLTAWLGDSPSAAGSETLIAELVAKTNTLPVLDYAPSGRTRGTGPSGTGTPKTAADTTEWELSSIKKGVS